MIKKRILNYKKIELVIIKKLFNYGCWGKGHLLIMRLKKGIPKEDVGYVNLVLKELIRKGLVLTKKTKYGTAAHLNVEKRKEIDEIRLEENL